MKKYRVNVNGTTYEIALEVMGEGEIPAAAPTAPAPAAAPAPVAAPAAGATEVKAPMPGNILDVKVKAGDAVKKGQVLIILEAMKMENEIMAPVDGTIVSVNATKGMTCENGTVLCVIG